MPLDMEDRFRVAFEARVDGLDGLNALVSTLKEGEDRAGRFQGEVLNLREAIGRLGQDGKTFTQVLASLALGGDQYTKVLSQVSDAAQHTLQSMAAYHRMASTPVKDSNVLGGQLVDAQFKEAIRQLSAAAQEIRLQQQSQPAYRTKAAGVPLAALEELKSLAAQSGFTLGGAPLTNVQRSLHEFANEAKELLGEIRRQLPSYRPYNQYTANPRGNQIEGPSGAIQSGRAKADGSGIPTGEVRLLSEKEVQRLAQMEAAAEATYNYFTKAAIEGGEMANRAIRRFEDLSKNILDQQVRTRVFYENVIMKEREVSSMHSALNNEMAFQLSQRGMYVPRTTTPRAFLGQGNAALEQAEQAALQALTTREAQGRIAAARSRVLARQKSFNPLDVVLDTETTIGSGGGSVNFNPQTFIKASADPSVFQRTEFHTSQVGRKILELFATNIPALRGRSVVGPGRDEAALLTDFYQGMRGLLDQKAGSGQPLTIGAHNPGFDFPTVHGAVGRLGLNRFNDFFARNESRVNLVGTEDPYLHLAALFAEQNPSKGMEMFLNKRGQLATTPEEMRFLGGWSNENLLRTLGLNVAPKNTPVARTGIGGLGISADRQVVLHSAETDAPLSATVYNRYAQAYNTASETLLSGGQVDWNGLAQRISRGRYKTMEDLFKATRAESLGKNPKVEARIDARDIASKMLSGELLHAGIGEKLSTIDSTPNLTTFDRSALAREVLRDERSGLMGETIKASGILASRGNEAGAQALYNYNRRRAAALDREAYRRKLLANPINPDDLQAARDQAAQLGASPLNLEYRDRKIAQARAFLAANPEAQTIVDPAAAQKLSNQAAYAKMMAPFAGQYGATPLSSVQSVLASISDTHAQDPQARYAQSMNLLRSAKKFYGETSDSKSEREMESEIARLRSAEYERQTVLQAEQKRAELARADEALKQRVAAAREKARASATPSLSPEEQLAAIKQRLGAAGGVTGSKAGEAGGVDAETLRRQLMLRLRGLGGGSGADELGNFPFDVGSLAARQARFREQGVLGRGDSAVRRAREQADADAERLLGINARGASGEQKLVDRIAQANAKTLEVIARKTAEIPTRRADDVAKDDYAQRQASVARARGQIRIDEIQERIDTASAERKGLIGKTDAKSTERVKELTAEITKEQTRQQNIKDSMALRDEKVAADAAKRAASTEAAEKKLDQLATERAKKAIELENQLAQKKVDNQKNLEDLTQKAQDKNSQRRKEAQANDARAQEQARLDREKFAAQQIGNMERDFSKRGESLRDVQDRMSPGFRDRVREVRQEIGTAPGRNILNMMQPPSQERPTAPEQYSPSYERYLASINRYQDRIDSSHIKLMGAWRDEENQLAHLKGIIDKMGTSTPEQQALKAEAQGLYAARVQQGQERLGQMQGEHDAIVEKARAQASKSEDRYGYDFQRESDARTRDLERRYSRRKETLEDYYTKTSPATQGEFESTRARVLQAMEQDLPAIRTRSFGAEMDDPIKGKESAYRRYAQQVENIDAQLAQKRQKYYQMEKEEIESIAILRMRLDNMPAGPQRSMEEGAFAARTGQSRERLAAERDEIAAAEGRAASRAQRARENFQAAPTASEGGGAGGGALLHLGSLIAQYYALQMIVKSTMLSYVEYAARTEQLRVVTEQMAKTNNLNVQSVLAQVEAVKDLNITTQDAHETVQKMMFAQLDLRKATELARLAQDAAVISNENSSQALEKIITGVVTGQTRMLHYMGLQVSMQQVVREETERLGRAPTEVEKRQAMLNKVLEQGVKIQGNYDASMLTANKQMMSLTRQWQEAENAVGGRLQPAFMRFIMLLSSSARYVQDNAESFAHLAAAITAAVAAISAYSVASIAVKAGGMLAGSLNPWLAIPAALVGIGIYKGMNKDQYEGRKEASTAVSDSIKQEMMELDAQHSVGALTDVDYMVAKKRAQERLGGVGANLSAQVGLDLNSEYQDFQRAALLRKNGIGGFFGTQFGANIGLIGTRANSAVNSIYNNTLGNVFGEFHNTENDQWQQAYKILAKFPAGMKPGQEGFEGYARTMLADKGYGKDEIEASLAQFKKMRTQSLDQSKDPLLNLRLIVTQQATELEDQLGAHVRKYKESIKELEEKFLIKSITDPIEKIKHEVEKEFGKSDIDEKVDEIQRAIGLLNIDQTIVDHYAELGTKLRSNKFTDAQLELLNKYTEALPAPGQAVPATDLPMLQKTRGLIAQSGLSEQQIQQYVGARREMVDIEKNNPDVALYGHLKDLQEFQQTRKQAIAKAQQYQIQLYNEELRKDEIHQRAKLEGEVVRLTAKPGIENERTAINEEYDIRIRAAQNLEQVEGKTREIEKEIRGLIIDQALEQEKLNKRVRDMNIAYEVAKIGSRSSVAEAGINAKMGGGEDTVDKQVAIFNERLKKNKEVFAQTNDADAYRRANLQDETNLEVGIINILSQRIQALRQANVEELKLKFARAQQIMEAQATTGIERELAINKAYEMRIGLIKQIRDEQMKAANTDRERKKVEGDAAKEKLQADIDRYVSLQNEFKKQIDEAKGTAGKVFDAMMTSSALNPGARQKAIRDMLHNTFMSTGRTIFENMTAGMMRKGILNLSLPGQVDKDGKPTFLGRVLDGTIFQHHDDPKKALNELLKNSPELALMVKKGVDPTLAASDLNTKATDENTKEIQKLNDLLNQILGFLGKGAGTPGASGEVAGMLNKAGIKDLSTSITPGTFDIPSVLTTVPGTVNKERLEQLMQQTKPMERQLEDVQSKVSYNLGALAGAGIPSAATTLEQKYAPMVEDAAKKYGVDPNLMKALVKSESGFNPEAVSKTGATGLGQFTKGTAKSFGLMGKGFDHRNDPAANADASAKYMSQLLKQTGGDEAKALSLYKGVAAGGATSDDVNKVLQYRGEYANQGVRAGTPDATSSQVQQQLTEIKNTVGGASAASGMAEEGSATGPSAGGTTNYGWDVPTGTSTGPSIQDLMDLPTTHRSFDPMLTLGPAVEATQASTSPLEAVNRVTNALGTLPSGSPGVASEIGNALKAVSAATGGALSTSKAIKAAEGGAGLTNPFIQKNADGSTNALGSVTGSLAIAGAEVGMGIDLAHNIKAGGAKGTIGAIGDVAGMAAMVDPEPISKAVLTTVAMVSQLAKALFGDPRAIRKKQIEDSLKAHNFTQADTITRTLDIAGKDVDFDYLGRARTGASPVGGPASTIHMNIDTMDAKSFMDNSSHITNAVRQQLTMNHPITDDIRQLSSNA